MRLYTNTRSRRAHMLLWGATVLAIIAVLVGISGFVLRDWAKIEFGLIVGPIASLMAAGMEFYCRRYVIALDIADGELRLETSSLTGTHHITGSAELGPRRHDKGLDLADAVRISQLTNSVAALRFAGIDNQYHFLSVGPRKRKYIVDITADPGVGDRIALALEEHSNG